MEEFRFENTVKLTESQYVAIWSVLPRKPWFAKLRLFVLTATGIILLFSNYTLLLGLLLLALSAAVVFVPGKLLPSGSRSLFRRHTYLRDALTYGVSDQRLWVRGEKIDASVQWSMLGVWREVEGFLLLHASGIPPVYLSLSRLKEEGLYSRVKDLAKSHAPEYNWTTRRRSR